MFFFVNSLSSRTYIFIKTYYLPNYLSSQALCELCIFADADIRKYNYLLEQFWTDFFPYIDNHMPLHHKLSKLSKDEVDQMNFIIEELLNELSGYFDETELDNSNIEFEKLIIGRIKQGIHLKSIRIIF